MLGGLCCGEKINLRINKWLQPTTERPPYGFEGVSILDGISFDLFQFLVNQRWWDAAKHVRYLPTCKPTWNLWNLPNLPSYLNGTFIRAGNPRHEGVRFGQGQCERWSNLAGKLLNGALDSILLQTDHRGCPSKPSSPLSNLR